AQDCDTTVASSERDTATQAEEVEVVDSIFAETEMPLACLPCFGFEDLQDWPKNIVPETVSSPFATPSALLCACCNPEELPSAYPAIINWFGISHHEEKLYVYMQALFAEDNKVRPIWLGICYHISYDAEWLIGEVNLCLNVMVETLLTSPCSMSISSPSATNTFEKLLASGHWTACQL
ncbi:hypothetical protein DSO57_1028275, partial [Entomophthora muscae]